jgi:NAD(P)H-flavin reductase
MSTTVEKLIPEWATVVATRRETHDTMTLTIETDDDFAPGQFHMLTAFGIGECPVSHSGHPRIGGVHEHTVRAVGAVSRALTELKPGDPIGIRGAFGVGWPMEALRGQNVVIVAGGIGLAPLRPVVLAIESNPGAYRRSALLVGARTPRDVPFRSDLDRWDASSAIDTFITVDQADESWTGAVGVVTRLFARAAVPADAIALLCGPEIMMRFAAEDLVDLGVAPDRIHVSMERNMECGIGVCGHCQIGGAFVCRDGPVMPWTTASALMRIPEL